jgi:xanthine dehydrogenase YagR molybdenum-binding subunit
MTARVPIGIPGVDLHDEERPLPAGEPPPWPANEQLTVVGRATRRADGAAKVTGAARYTADVQLTGMLHARRICATVPHARIRRLDTAAAERHPEFRALHVLDAPMGMAVLRGTPKEPGSPWPIVRYAGQPIGAVAAVTPEGAQAIAALVRIEYEPLPFTLDLDAARGSGAPLVFPGPVDMAATAGGGGALAGLPQHGNVRGPTRAARGDVVRGLREAAVVVEGEFRTQVQTHAPMETHGVVAEWRGQRLTVYASTQGTASVQDELMRVFHLSRAQVRVVTEFMGGGFGAKFGAGSYGVLAAHLARAARAPVRLMLDRREEHESAGHRPATVQRLRVGARKDGALTAIELVSHGTAGVAVGAGVGSFAERLYACPNFAGAQHDVFINAGPGAAFRAPGFPQGAFALEQLLDELAERLDLDPLVLRDRIDTRDESGAAARRVERRLGAARFEWARRRPPGADRGPVKRGLGVAQAFWPRIISPDSSCEVRLGRDGVAEVRSGVQDLGGGTKTVLAQIVAEELGLRAEDVRVRIGDTDFPRGPNSGGSVTIQSLSPAVRHAAHAVRQELLGLAAAKLKQPAHALTLERGQVTAPPSGRALPLRKACALMPGPAIAKTATRTPDYAPPTGVTVVGGSGGVQFAEVEVDTTTGVIRVPRVVAAHDCGRPMNPLGVESQIHGGVIQGLSYALFEDRVLDAHTGLFLNANLEQYKLAGTADVPVIETILVPDYRGRSATDAGGIGEPATVATAAAIANAVHNATGVRLRRLPMTPANVLAALAAAAKVRP